MTSNEPKADLHNDPTQMRGVDAGAETRSARAWGDEPPLDYDDPDEFPTSMDPDLVRGFCEAMGEERMAKLLRRPPVPTRWWTPGRITTWSIWATVVVIAAAVLVSVEAMTARPPMPSNHYIAPPDVGMVPARLPAPPVQEPAPHRATTSHEATFLQEVRDGIPIAWLPYAGPHTTLAGYPIEPTDAALLEAGYAACPELAKYPGNLTMAASQTYAKYGMNPTLMDPGSYPFDNPGQFVSTASTYLCLG